MAWTIDIEVSRGLDHRYRGARTFCALEFLGSFSMLFQTTVKNIERISHSWSISYKAFSRVSRVSRVSYVGFSKACYAKTVIFVQLEKTPSTIGQELKERSFLIYTQNVEQHVSTTRIAFYMPSHVQNPELQSSTAIACAWIFPRVFYFLEFRFVCHSDSVPDW